MLWVNVVNDRYQPDLGKCYITKTSVNNVQLKAIFFSFFLSFFFFLSAPRSMWDLSSLTCDQPNTPCTGRRSLNRWTAWEVQLKAVINSVLNFVRFLDRFYCQNGKEWSNDKAVRFVTTPDFTSFLLSHLINVTSESL